MPGIDLRLAGQVVRFVQAIRKEDIDKKPGVAETLDWVAALVGLEVADLSVDPEVIHDSLLCLLKTDHDRRAISREVAERIVGKVA